MQQSIFRRRIPKHEGLEVVRFGIRINEYCEYCGSPAGWDTFKTNQNRIEYNLSGHCQRCQDDIGGSNPGVIPFHGARVKRVSGFKSAGRERPK
jgi:hypothetical protein